MTSAILWVGANWEYILVGFYCLEKIVKVTPCEWDDVLVDGFRAIFLRKNV